MRPIPGLDGCFWDDRGFFVRQMSDLTDTPQIDAAIARDRQAERYLVGHEHGCFILRLRYRLRIVEEVLGSGGIPLGEVKETWAPKLKVHP